MKFNSFFAILLSVFVLTSCSLSDFDSERPQAIKTISKSDRTWLSHLDQLKQIQSYTAEGQLGYISPKKRFSSRFEWQYHNSQHFTLKLYSTISSSSLVLQMDNAGMTISDNKGNQRSETDANILIREIVGMDIPLEQFATWLKGQPSEKSDYAIGENHYLAQFSYSEDNEHWTADYLVYQTVESVVLPKDILLKNGQQTLKIRIEHWKL